jgi:uncharacterized membrane protein
MWKAGVHMNRHQAGTDLSLELESAPHGKEVFEKASVKKVGALQTETPRDERITGFLATLLDRFPMLHRHPHPMIVHFPMAYPVAASLFTLIHLLGIWKTVPFDTYAFAMLILGVVFTPLGLATGFFTWWLNYHAKMVHHVKCKIVCSFILLGAHVACLILKLTVGPTIVYTVLMLWLLPNALLLGYHGGQLTFPYKHE